VDRKIRFDFERMDAFKVALQLMPVINELALGIPEREGRAYMKDQLRRAVNSIPLNIAEGAGEYAPAEKARFYRIAKRSATECASQILACQADGLLVDAPRVEVALDLLQREVAMLVTLVRRCGERDRNAIDIGDAA